MSNIFFYTCSFFRLRLFSAQTSQIFGDPEMGQPWPPFCSFVAPVPIPPRKVTTILDRISTPPGLPPIQWCTRATTKTRHFFHRWNGGRGGLKFSSIFSKIAILDRIKWEIEAPLPPIQWCTRATTRTRHFFHHWNGGVVLIFHPFCPRL